MNYKEAFKFFPRGVAPGILIIHSKNLLKATTIRGEIIIKKNLHPEIIKNIVGITV